MPYIQQSKTYGSTMDFVYGTSLGYKLTPFVAKDIRDTNFDKSLSFYNGGNTHTLLRYAQRAGGAMAGEYYPASACGSDTPEDRMAYARAYAKFTGKLYQQAALLTAIAERQSTIDMVAVRLKQIHKGLKHLRKGQFRLFLMTFGLKPKEKHVHKRWARPREVSSLWLEYWMGWAPTVGDVYNAIEFLGSEIPSTTVRAGSRVPWDHDKTETAWGVTKTVSSKRGFHSVWVKAKVVITNPTLFTMQGLGLANPLKTVWETISFSWLADWFTNIGQVLGQLTDFLGLQVKDLVVSRKSEATITWVCEDARPIFGYDNPRKIWRSRDFIGFKRVCGGTIPPVRPYIRLPNGLSITRGATLASLIVQLFAPKRAIQ